MEKNLTLYEKIREDILSGKFGDNEKMTEIRLAKNYEVSRTPIREVLRQLEFEYLVKDGYIYKPSPEDYRNLFEMRTLIEAHAVEKADRKSTRLNSSHVAISYAVFCFKKKN